MNIEQPYRKINISGILLGSIGLLLSLYALILHIQLLLKKGHQAFCDINATFNCSSVIASAYGEFASIPLGAFGMSYFIAIIAAAILPKIAVISVKQQTRLEFVLSMLGFFSIIALFYISHFILNAICPVCSLIHLLILAYFILTIIRLLKHNSVKDSPSQYNYLGRFSAICLCLGLQPIFAGILAPIIINKYFSTAINTEVANATVNKIEEELKLQDKILSFNRDNSVGDGEDYRRGSEHAKVIVQIFSDFGCPHCKEMNAPLIAAQDQLGLDKVLIVYKFFPLSNKCNDYMTNEGWYPYSCILPQATRCAGRQGKFWEFKEWAFAGQSWTAMQRAQNFSSEGLRAEAQTLNINIQKFMQCIDSGMELRKIKNDAQLAHQLNISGTPFILINGEEYQGPHTLEGFVQALTL